MKVGAIPANYFEGQGNTTAAGVKAGASPDGNGEPHLAQLLDLMQLHRVPGNIESAAITPAADDTWEDHDVITPLNTALTAAGAPTIRTSEAVELLCTLEWVNGEAGVNNAKYGHGDTPDDDDTVRTFATAAAAASEYQRGAILITDTSGQIKLEVDDKANLSLVVHLEAYRYARSADSSS